VKFVKWRLEWTPKPLDADAGPESFSEGRAFRHITYLSETIGDHQARIRVEGRPKGAPDHTRETRSDIRDPVGEVTRPKEKYKPKPKYCFPLVLAGVHAWARRGHGLHDDRGPEDPRSSSGASRHRGACFSRNTELSKKTLNSAFVCLHLQPMDS